MGTRVIHLASLGGVPDEVLAAIELSIAAAFDADVVRYVPSINVSIAHDRARNQYNSTRLIEALSEELLPDDTKMVGVTGVDLFVPVLTFVFGEAQLGGQIAVASLFRLRNGFYGLPDDDEILVARAGKEVIHELGHTFGLIHCENPVCVMHVSTAVEEVDVKGDDFCAVCRRAIRDA